MFGIVAMLNIILFVKPSASTFLAIFFIGAVFTGQEVANQASKMFSGQAPEKHEEKSPDDKYEGTANGIVDDLEVIKEDRYGDEPAGLVE